MENDSIELHDGTNNSPRLSPSWAQLMDRILVILLSLLLIYLFLCFSVQYNARQQTVVQQIGSRIWPNKVAIP